MAAPYWLSLINVRHPWHHMPQHHFLILYAKGHTENQKRTGNGIPTPSFLTWSSSTALAIGIAPCAGVQNKLNRCDCKRQCCSRATEQQKLLQLTNDLHKLQLVGRGWRKGQHMQLKMCNVRWPCGLFWQPALLRQQPQCYLPYC